MLQRTVNKTFAFTCLAYTLCLLPLVSHSTFAQEAETPDYQQFLKYIQILPEKDKKIIHKNMVLLSKDDITSMNHEIEKAISQVYGLPKSPKKTPEQIRNKAEQIKMENIAVIVKTRIGKNQILHALQKSANQCGKIIGIRSVNEAALSKIADELPTKPMAIKGKSADSSKSSLLAGYIPVDAKFSKAGGHSDEAEYSKKNRAVLETYPDRFKAIPLTTTDPITGETRYGVYSTTIRPENGNPVIHKEKWKTEAELAKKPNKYKKHEVLGQRVDGDKFEPITADVDPAFVGIPKNNSNENQEVTVSNKGDLGLVTENDIEVIGKFNQALQPRRSAVMHHGPAAYDPAFTPLGHSEEIILGIPNHPIVRIQGMAGSKSTQELLTDFLTHGEGKNYIVHGTNYAMCPLNFKKPKIDQSAESILKVDSTLDNKNDKNIETIKEKTNLNSVFQSKEPLNFFNPEQYLNPVSH